MKKTILLLMLAVIGFSAAASPVDAESAAAVARSFIAQRVANAGHVAATVVYTHMKPQSSSPAMYAVNVTYGNNGKGFVIVSADDVAYPVLGYSVAAYWPTTGAKGTGAAVPLCSQITEYLNGISSQIEQASSSSYRHPSMSVAEWQQLLSTNVTPLTTPPDSVGPLLVTQWSQSPYYNEYCPEDANNPGNKAVTGCVATAMAQIIRYWQHPVHGRGTHTYEDNTNGNFGTLSADFANATYDYANMPFTLNASSTPAQVNAVAHLIYHCGVACDMTYGVGGSGSYDIVARAGLINYFHYSPDISYVEKSNVSATQWDSILHHHLAAGEPLMFCGDDPNAGGHAFVCDGYKTDGYYHFNFGWDGYGDGWYRTDAVNPSYQFNSGQSVLAGIVPDNNGNVILANRLGTSTFTVGNQPLEFYNTRGHDVYRANCYTNTCNNNVLFTSSDATKRLNIEMIDADCQNLNVYDGEGGTLLTGISSVITASGCNVTTLGPSQVTSTGNALYLEHQGDFRCVGYKVRISQTSASATSYIVSAAPNNASMGSVTGGGTYDAGATVTLTATANCGYQFSHWTDSYGNVVSSDATYTFTVTGNGSFTAVFEAVAVTEFDAVATSGQTLHFTVNSDGTSVTITGHEANISGDLIIPETVVDDCNNSYTVTRVGNSAFNSNYLTSVTIPTSVTYFGPYAFYYSPNMARTYYTGTIVQWLDIDIEWWGNPISISHNFYINGEVVRDLVIPEGVTTIKTRAFEWLFTLNTLTLPSTITTLGVIAFNNCPNLTSVTCNAVVPPVMEGGVFQSDNMDIPVNVPCGSLSAYQAANEWSSFTNLQEDCSRGEFNIRTCTGHTLRFEVNNVTHTATVIGYVGQCTGSLTVPAWFSVDGERYEVTAIGPRAFENCTGLESVILPRSITLVDTEAFKGCSGLISVDIK